LRNAPSPRRKPVVFTPAVIILGFMLDDPSVDRHLLEIPVQRARHEAHRAFRGLFDFRSDACTVALAIGKRE
jgi:hypothetical protein